MLLTRPKSPTGPRSGGGGGGGPLSTRGGTLLVAALLSLLAGMALLVFLRQYREDVTSSDRARVLVAASLIPKGTTGEVLLEKKLYRVAQVREDDLRDGALTDPSELEGRAATADVFPGHQLKLDDFEDANGKIGSRLASFDRAITVPVDRAHGMVGKVDAGDRVDVITTDNAGTGSMTVAIVAARNALVLAVPDGDGSGTAGRLEQVTIRVSDRAAASIAAAADGGKVWLVLRPPVGARSSTPDAMLNGTAGNGQPIDADVDISARVRSR
jgi:Flp pilus assembly protein CpaB